MRWRFFATITGIAAVAASAVAQYPGRVAKTDKPAPILRSVAVLEWTGAPGKPSASRLVPVAIFDGEQINDGTLYMSRPWPLALSGGVEYELQTAGKPMGLFDVFQAGELDGAWRGFGVWKPLSAKDAAAAASGFNSSSLAAPVHVEDDDKPVLKRKHPKGTDTDDSPKPADTTEAKTTAEAKTQTAASSDPDRPTLTRKSGDDTASAPAQKPASTGVDDPDRPTIRRTRRSLSDAAMAETSTVEPDPDRPRLKRGRPEGSETPDYSQLGGLPPSMQQSVAVSDARTRPEHPWKFTWADPDDEQKFKTALEAVARTALGLDTPPTPAKPVRRTASATRRVAKSIAPPLAPVELADEKFQAFELTFGSSATLVLTASTPKPDIAAPVATNAPAGGPDSPDGPPRIRRGKPVQTTSANERPTAITSPTPAAKAAPQKFVTLIAQPDLYGGVIVVYKSVTDSAHLDVTPRMRLIDAVDIEGDNRGELLFELRGDSQRQFALYRVLRGSAEQMFATVAIP